MGIRGIEAFTGRAALIGAMSLSPAPKLNAQQSRALSPEVNAQRIEHCLGKSKGYQVNDINNQVSARIIPAGKEKYELEFIPYGSQTSQGVTGINNLSLAQAQQIINERLNGNPSQQTGFEVSGCMNPRTNDH